MNLSYCAMDMEDGLKTNGQPFGIQNGF